MITLYDKNGNITQSINKAFAKEQGNTYFVRINPNTGVLFDPREDPLYSLKLVEMWGKVTKEVFQRYLKYLRTGEKSHYFYVQDKIIYL